MEKYKVGDDIIRYWLILRRYQKLSTARKKNVTMSLTSKPANGILSEIISHSSTENE